MIIENINYKFQKFVIYLKNCMESKIIIPEQKIIIEDLLNEAKNENTFEKLRSNVKYIIFNQPNDIIGIIIEISYNENEKNSIKINQIILNTVSEFEGFFIGLDSVKIEFSKRNSILIYATKNKQSMEELINGDDY